MRAEDEWSVTRFAANGLRFVNRCYKKWCDRTIDALSRSRG